MFHDADILRTVKKAIVEVLHLQIDPDAIPDDEIIFGSGIGADSITAIRIVFAIEEAFDFEVDDEDLRVDLFASIPSLANYVKRRLAENTKA